MSQQITTSDYLEALKIIRSFLECGCNEMEITALAILEGKSFHFKLFLPKIIILS